MSTERSFSESEVDALVRSYLTRQAETVDAHQLLAGVRARLSPRENCGAARKTPEAPSRRRKRGWLWAVAAAGLLLAAFLSGLHLGPAQASAEMLVRDAQKAHALPLDRCYLVQHRPEPGMADRYPLLAPRHETRLWTRGDRFWIEAAAGDRKLAWGRDDQGRVWLTRSQREGIRFEAGEIPEPIDVACDVLSMRLETLLDEVLADFDLKREDPPPGQPTGTRMVRAELKPGRRHPGLRAALLEIDPESKVLQRVVLWRTFGDQQVATVTFTLVETRSQPDTTYELEGHVDEDASVYTKSFHPERRRPKLLAYFAWLALKGRLKN